MTSLSAASSRWRSTASRRAARHLGLGHPRHDLKNVVARRLAGHGDDTQDIPRRRGETTDAGEKHVAKRQPDPLLAPLSDSQQLLREEGIASTPRVKTSYESAGWRASEDAGQLVMNFGRRESSKLEALDLCAALQLREQGQKRMALVQLIGAVRADEHDAAVGEVSDQEAEEVTSRSVRPVEVLEGDHGGRIGGDALDQPEHLRGRASTALPRLLADSRSSLSVPGSKVGYQLQDGISSWADDASELVAWKRHQPRTQGSHERVVGPRSISEVHASAKQNAQSGAGCVRAELR